MAAPIRTPLYNSSSQTASELTYPFLKRRKTFRILDEHFDWRQLSFGAGFWLSVATVPAQVVFDGSFGTSGALTGPNYNISASAGLTRGNNLFQSFSQFDLKQ